MEGIATLSATTGRALHRQQRRVFVQRYWAFLSYSHRDEATAAWLQHQLEGFGVPKRLIGRGTPFGIIPARLTPIFRDRHELAAGGDLRNDIAEALGSARFLIVLCSPASATSRWTNEEIRLFKQLRPDGEVLAAIIEGEPWASEMPGREAEECFPPALKVEVGPDGLLTDERAEPIAADLREGRDGKHHGVLKLVAGMLDVGLDELVQRESHRRQRRMMAITAASLVGMLATSGLAVTAMEARDTAREQRREAEGLIGFMLGDLKDRLEPIGRLEALDAVATRALAYYEKQDKGSISDEGLSQRARALTMMGDIAQRKGDLDSASRRYREAAASTSELARRYPDDPQRLFDHAQNVFYTGYIAWQRGQLEDGARAFRDYKALADRMIALQPGKREWLLERIYADTNLGLVLNTQERFEEAARVLGPMLSSVERLHAADPKDPALQAQLAEALVYLADARQGAGEISAAAGLRERQIALLGSWLAADPGDMTMKRKLLQAHNGLAKLQLARGDIGGATAEVDAALRLADELGRADPSNTEWADRISDVQLTAAEVRLAAGRAMEAEAAVRSGCDGIARLISKDPSVVDWSGPQRRRCLLVRAVVDLEAGRSALALEGMRNLIASPGADSASRIARGDRAYAKLIAGRAEARLGRAAAAREQWRSGASAWTPAPVKPEDLALQAALLRLAGDEAAAAPLQRRLQAIGYRNPIIGQVAS